MGGLHPNHQWLAIADKNVVIAIVLLDDGRLDFLVQVEDQLVALVEQVVGGLARPSLQAADGVIQGGDLLRIGIDDMLTLDVIWLLTP